MATTLTEGFALIGADCVGQPTETERRVPQVPASSERIRVARKRRGDDKESHRTDGNPARSLP